MAVRPDAVRQANGEPAAANAEISDDAAFADRERVHDLFRLLPRVAIRSFEETELFGRKQTAVLRRSRRQEADGGDDRQRRAHLHRSSSPGTPGEVITSGERIRSS